METNGYRLLLPEGTLDYFNISDVKESSSEIVIYLDVYKRQFYICGIDKGSCETS